MGSRALSSSNSHGLLLSVWGRGGSVGVWPAQDRDDGWECACVGSCPLPCSMPPNMSMLSDAWSTATPGCRLLARPGAHQLILEMTCRLSCCYHIGAEGGRGEDKEEKSGKGLCVRQWGGVPPTFVLRPCSAGLLGSLYCHPGRPLGQECFPWPAASCGEGTVGPGFTTGVLQADGQGLIFQNVLWGAVVAGLWFSYFRPLWCGHKLHGFFSLRLGLCLSLWKQEYFLEGF